MKALNISILAIAALFYSCGSDHSGIDASGVFEATEIIVSSEATGKLLSFTISEGDPLNSGQIAGQIDSSQLHLNKLQVIANQKALLSNRPDMKSQLNAIQEEIDKAEFEKKRIEKLLKGDVATQKQLDDINAQLAILKANYDAKKRSLAIATTSIDAQSSALDVQIDLINDQINRSSIQSPIEGNVLVKYAEEGEFTSMGKPLFKIADLDKMILVAYVTSDQLAKINLGQSVKVLAEYGEEGNKEYTGEVIWISGKSEFTPKTIQTQDERANLVYAVKISVENDGFLKIGMYGGIKLSE